jgi:misacylated tRNA(Ala) deacylase
VPCNCGGGVSLAKISLVVTKLLYYTDSYLVEFDSEVVSLDRANHAVALAETAFFPTGGGQPHDVGRMVFGGAAAKVVDVIKTAEGIVWHRLDEQFLLPEIGELAHGAIDWNRRYPLMRMHTALHILNGVVWVDYGARVTGANMVASEGRLDFELPSMSRRFAKAVEARINERVQLDSPVRVSFLPRSEADRDRRSFG